MKRDPAMGLPLVEGLFYPAAKDDLIRKVDSLLKGEKGNSPAVILPHAAYEVVGETYGKSLMACAGRQVSRILLLAPAHREPEPHAALPVYERFATPLGEIRMDREILAKLRESSPLFKVDPMPFEEEHSPELVYPFLQRLFPDIPVTPVLMGKLKSGAIKSLAKGLSEVLLPEKGNLLTIISTNLSRFVLSATAEREADSFAKYIRDEPLTEKERQDITACGMNCVDLFRKARLYGGSFRETERFSRTLKENRKDTSAHYGAFLLEETI